MKQLCTTAYSEDVDESTIKITPYDKSVKVVAKGDE